MWKHEHRQQSGVRSRTAGSKWYWNTHQLLYSPNLTYLDTFNRCDFPKFKYSSWITLVLYTRGEGRLPADITQHCSRRGGTPASTTSGRGSRLVMSLHGRLGCREEWVLAPASSCYSTDMYTLLGTAGPCFWGLMRLILGSAAYDVIRFICTGSSYQRSVFIALVILFWENISNHVRINLRAIHANLRRKTVTKRIEYRSRIHSGLPKKEA